MSFKQISRKSLIIWATLGPRGLIGSAGLAVPVWGDEGDPGAAGLPGSKGQIGDRGPDGQVGFSGLQGRKGILDKYINNVFRNYI